LAPVDDFDIVKKQYKRLVKENHPTKMGVTPMPKNG